MKIHALLAPALAATLTMPVPTFGQAALPEMLTIQRSLDGNAADITGPSVSTDPTNERAWGAQGRRRAAWVVESRERQLFGEDEFDTRMLSIEVDDDNENASDNRMFTLTQRKEQEHEDGTSTVFPAKIRVDSIEDPSTPSPVQDPDFTFQPYKSPRFLRVDPERDLLLVVLSDELRIYDYGSNGYELPYDPQDYQGVVTVPTGSTACGNQFTEFKNVWLADIQVAPGVEKPMALVKATVSSSTCFKPHPQPTGLLVLDLSDPSTPFFYGTEVDGILANQSWDPCREAGTPCEDWVLGSLTHVRVGGRDLVYGAGGSSATGPGIDLREFDVTDVSDSTVGILETAESPYELTPGDGLFAVVADPDAPAMGSDFLYLIGQHHAYVVDRANLDPAGGFSLKSMAQFGGGPQGDAHLVLSSTGGRELWTLQNQHADYHFRVTDFTQDPGPVRPDVTEAFYSAGPTDGAAMHPSTDYAYLPTFGGVGRWDVRGSQPIPPSGASYQPADDVVTGQHFTVEHVEFENLGVPGAPDWHLLAPTAKGDFFAWPIDPDSHDPDHLYDPEPGSSYAPGSGYWTAGTYGNDVAVGVNPGTGDMTVLIDYSQKVAPPAYPAGQIGIGRYTFDPQAGLGSGAWSSPAIEWSDPMPGLPDPDIVPNVTDLSVVDEWLLAGAFGGFLVVDWTADPPMQQVTDHVYIDDLDVGGESAAFDEVRGIERHGDRIFVSLVGDDYRTAVAMYGFDAASGLVVDGSGAMTEDPIQILVDGHDDPSKQDDFAGVHSSGGKRLSLTDTPTGNVRLYVGTSNGYVLEIDYSPTYDVMTPLSYWHNGGYFEEIMDTDVHKVPLSTGGFGAEGFAGAGGPDYTLRILVSKRAETFAIIQPPDMP